MTVTSWTLSFKDAVIGHLAFDLTPAAALQYFTAKGLKPTFAWQDMIGEQHTSAFTVAKMMQLDMLADTQALLTDAISKGHSFEWFRQNLQPQLEAKGWWGKQPMTDPLTGITKDVQLGSPWRLQTIFRTNLQVAYSVGSWQEIERQKPVAPFLMYDAVDDWRVRPEHARLDGLVLPVDDPFWATHYPPNGWNCRCGVVQLSQEQMERFQKNRGKPPAPDKAPKIKRVPWTNPRTGKIHKVPEDLDPGWDYHPGKAGLKGQQDLMAEKIAAMPAALKAAAEEGLALAAKAEQAAAAKVAAKAAQAALAKQEGAAALARATAKAQGTAAKNAAQSALEGIAAGTAKDPGSFLAEAYKKLAAADGWPDKLATEKLADIQALAEALKAKHATQTVLSGAKKQVLLGKPLTPKQTQALDSLGDEGKGEWFAKIQPELDQVQDYKAAYAMAVGDNPSKADLEAFLKLPKAGKKQAVAQYQAEAQTQQELIDQYVDLFVAENIFEPSDVDLALFAAKTKAEKAATIAKMQADALAEVYKADAALAALEGKATALPDLTDEDTWKVLQQLFDDAPVNDSDLVWWGNLSATEKAQHLDYLKSNLVDTANPLAFAKAYKGAYGKLPKHTELVGFDNVDATTQKGILDGLTAKAATPAGELTDLDKFKVLQGAFDGADVDDDALAWFNAQSKAEQKNTVAELAADIEISGSVDPAELLQYAKAYKTANGDLPDVEGMHLFNGLTNDQKTALFEVFKQSTPAKAAPATLKMEWPDDIDWDADVKATSGTPGLTAKEEWQTLQAIYKADGNPVTASELDWWNSATATQQMEQIKFLKDYIGDHPVQLQLAL